MAGAFDLEGLMISSRPVTRQDSRPGSPGSSYLLITDRGSNYSDHDDLPSTNRLLQSPTTNPLTVAETLPKANHQSQHTLTSHKQSNLKANHASESDDIFDIAQTVQSSVNSWHDYDASYADMLFDNKELQQSDRQTEKIFESVQSEDSPQSQFNLMPQPSYDNHSVPVTNHVEPSREVLATKPTKQDMSRNASLNGMKTASVAKSQSGKYLFRPLSSTRTITSDNAVGANHEMSKSIVDQMIEKQMSSMFGKTIVSRPTNNKKSKNVDDNTSFNGDIFGATAILTNRPPSGRTSCRNTPTINGHRSAGEEVCESELVSQNKIKNIRNAGKNSASTLLQQPWGDDDNIEVVVTGRRVCGGLEGVGGGWGDEDGRSTPSSYAQPMSRPSSGMSGRQLSIKSRTRYRHTPSFVDETLFGDNLEESSFPAPWNKPPPSSSSARTHRTRPFVFDCTDYRAKALAEAGRVENEGQRSRPQSRSSSVQGKHEMRQRSNSVQSRPSSSLQHRARSHGASAVKRESYVDETLFGPPLQEAEWAAPWDQNKNKTKPIMFDATDYRKKNAQAGGGRQGGGRNGGRGNGGRGGKSSNLYRTASAGSLAVWK